MHSIPLSERGSGLLEVGAISLDGDAWPLVICRVRRTPNDEEVIATLRAQELLLDRAESHAVLIEHAAGEPRLDHILLWRAFEQLHARRLARYCVGRAFVTALPSERFASSRVTRVPEARFDDEQKARAWLLARLGERVS